MALTDFNIFGVLIKEKARIKRVSNGKFVVTGGCESSRVAVSRYLKTLAFIEASSGTIKIKLTDTHDFSKLNELIKKSSGVISVKNERGGLVEVRKIGVGK